MIVFDLVCDNDHEFESWFANSDAFDKLNTAGAVACPECGDTGIRKSLMAPAVSGTRKKSERMPVHAGEYMKALRALRQQVEQNCDYVGERFPEEARRMYYGEADHRNIYGEASEDEAKSLTEEGIEFQKIPWAPKTDA